MDILNLIFALISIALGAISWLNPRYAMASLDLCGGSTTMGMSEVRASAGALFVGMGVGAIAIGGSGAFAMLGFCWLGAATGRLTSLVLDGQSRKKWVFFGIEASVGLATVLINHGAIL